MIAPIHLLGNLARGRDKFAYTTNAKKDTMYRVHSTRKIEIGFELRVLTAVNRNTCQIIDASHRADGCAVRDIARNE